jgi:hypothetical protein
MEVSRKMPPPHGCVGSTRERERESVCVCVCKHIIIHCGLSVCVCVWMYVNIHKLSVCAYGQIFCACDIYIHVYVYIHTERYIIYYNVQEKSMYVRCSIRHAACKYVRMYVCVYVHAKSFFTYNIYVHTHYIIYCNAHVCDVLHKHAACEHVHVYANCQTVLYMHTHTHAYTHIHTHTYT